MVRIPVVPGVNATIDEMTSIAAFVKSLPHVESVELLNYHRLGEAKFASLGMVSKAKDLQPCSKDEMRAFGEAFTNRGLRVSIS